MEYWLISSAIKELKKLLLESKPSVIAIPRVCILIVLEVAIACYVCFQLRWMNIESLQKEEKGESKIKSPLDPTRI